MSERGDDPAIGPRRPTALRFVLLEHRWKGVHWDFMLETGPGQPLRTWAIEESIVPGLGLTQPARSLPDHRNAYLDYEGEVSDGRGSVRRIDRGEYDRLEWSDDRVVVRLVGNQLVGLAELTRVDRAGGRAETPSWNFRLGNRD